MNKDDLMHAITDIDDAYIEQAADHGSASGLSDADKAAAGTAAPGAPNVSPATYGSAGSAAYSGPGTTPPPSNAIPINGIGKNGKNGNNGKKRRKMSRGAIAGTIAACLIGVVAIGTVANVVIRSSFGSSGSYATDTAYEDYAPAAAEYDSDYDYDDYDDYGYDSYATEESADFYMEDSEYSSDYSESAAEGRVETEATIEDAADNSGTIDADKLIYTCDLSIQTKDYATSKQAILHSITAHNGLIEYENETNSDYSWYLYDETESATRTGYMNWYVTIRIPSSEYETFLSGLNDSGKVISKSASATNVSKEYHETEVRISSLETQLEKLQEMMEQAETIDEMITVEYRLSDVEYELNLQKSYLAGMDTDIAYSTVNLSLEEVATYTRTEVEEPGFGERILEACTDALSVFLDAMESLLILIIYLLPFAVVILVIVLVIRAIIRRRKKRKAAKNQTEKKP